MSNNIQKDQSSKLVLFNDFIFGNWNTKIPTGTNIQLKIRSAILNNHIIFIISPNMAFLIPTQFSVRFEILDRKKSLIWSKDADLTFNENQSITVESSIKFNEIPKS